MYVKVNGSWVAATAVYKKVIINNLTANNVSYENNKVNNITNVKEALDYLNEKLN